MHYTFRQNVAICLFWCIEDDKVADKVEDKVSGICDLVFHLFKEIVHPKMDILLSFNHFMLF